MPSPNGLHCAAHTESGPPPAVDREGSTPMNAYPHLKRWFNEIAERPAVQRGVEILAKERKPFRTDAEREILFGAAQYKRH